MNKLLEDGAWFTRAKEVRLLVVRTSSDIRKTALRVLAGLEFLPDNRSAWVIIPDAHTASDPGWQVRANRLMAHWEERRKAFLENERIEMPEARIGQTLPEDRSWPRNSLPISPMRDACAAVIAALRPPLEGFVIVLVPTTVANLKAMSSEIEALAVDPTLAACRWVWVLDADKPWPDVLDQVGELGLRCECIPDPEQQKKDFAAMLASPPTMIGRAGPRGVTPPRRINDPPPMPPEERAAALRAAGVNPEYCEKAPELQRLILGAAVAMKNGDGADAVRQQEAAGDLALSLQVFDVAVLCRVALGSYLTALGRRDEALQVLNQAAALAREHGLALQEAQAHLGAGLLLSLAKRYLEAADEYAVCARCAEEAKVPVLAIESWRMSGQVSLQARDREKAALGFREAIRVAEASEVETVQDSTASESARKLAEIYDRLDMPDQAESLRAEAEAMERGEVGIKPTVPVDA
jgi:tetratricopeptide (TPR) repeat protein